MCCKPKRVYQCEDTPDGIFSAIYDAWASRYGHKYIEIRENIPGEDFHDMELFTEYINVPADSNKAGKVAESIRSKISEDAYETVMKSTLSFKRGKADAIYRFLQLGFHAGGTVMEQLSHPYVFPLFEMERRINFEVQHYYGFLRFCELENHILAAKIRPENHILSLLAEHFADRFPEENWMIYDAGRRAAAFHAKGYPWIMADQREIDTELLEHYSEGEKDMQAFWQAFVDAIGIKDRYNEKLQYQMMPNRFREFLREVPYKPRK